MLEARVGGSRWGPALGACIGGLHWRLALEACIGGLHWGPPIFGGGHALGSRVGESRWGVALGSRVGESRWGVALGGRVGESRWGIALGGRVGGSRWGVALGTTPNASIVVTDTTCFPKTLPCPRQTPDSRYFLALGIALAKKHRTTFALGLLWAC